MIRTKWFPLLGLIPALMLLEPGCGGTKVTRTAADTTVDLSGYWNDTDSRLVADEMVQDCLARPWVQKFRSVKNQPPDVLVGVIRNKSHEHINTETFIKDLERALINSGEVNFVAGGTVRQELRDEKRDQDLYSSDETRKEMGEEAGADYMLTGTINTILDQEGKEQVRFYQVDLTLTDLLTHRQVWLGQKKIKKMVENSKARW